MEQMMYGDLESEICSDDLQSETKEMKMILEKSSGEREFPSDLESDKKKMKMSLGGGDGDLEVEDEEQLIPTVDSDVEVEDDDREMDFEFSSSSEYSSDGELKEEDREEYNKYLKQVVESGGFDIERRPPLRQCILAPVNNLKEEDEAYKKLCSYSQLAIKTFNEENTASYEYVKFEKAVWALCAGCKYYITFEAKTSSEEATTTFQALIYQGISNGDGTYPVEVVLVRKKSAASQEDNRILLC